MKALLLAFAAILWSHTCFSQDQEDEPFSYKVNGLVYFYKYDVEGKKKIDEPKIPKEGLKFKIVGEETFPGDSVLTYLVKFLPITNDKIKVGGKSMDLKGNETFVNSEDNDAFFWIIKDKLEALLEAGYVSISYNTGFISAQVTYGASLSLPFKYRPKINGQHVKITPDITLGGFLGARWRLSETKAYYLSAPVVTLGMTTLAINDNNNLSDPNKGDGLVLGITTSTGMIFQFNEFQFGLMLGMDRAAGELGADWIYNDKPWYSFSIGYTFVGRGDAEQSR